MKPTCDEILAVMNEIGKSITVTKHYPTGSLQHFDLSNGWQIEVFDEGCGEWDYLQTVRPPGGDLVNLYHAEHGEYYESIMNRFDPTKEALDALGLGDGQ